MKNNKGFTLIELLGVLILLSIIALILSPVITGIIKDSKKQIKESNIDEILKSAYNWSLDNSDQIPVTVDDEITVTIDTLKRSGHLKKDTSKLDNEEVIDDSCLVRIRKVSYDANLSNVQNSRYYNDLLFIYECN